MVEIAAVAGEPIFYPCLAEGDRTYRSRRLHHIL